jgi:hypothetical protein
MRLDIYGQFVVNVVSPNGGWSKGRPIAVIEEREASRCADLLIQNDLVQFEIIEFLSASAGLPMSLPMPSRA